MALPRVAYKNHFNNGFGAASWGISTSAAAAQGFPLANCYDWLTYDFWKAAASGNTTVQANCGAASYSANCWGVVGHNAHENPDPLYCNTAPASGTYVQRDTVTPTDDGVIFRAFNTVSSQQYFQFRCANSAPNPFPYFAELFIGTYLELPMGMEISFSPPQMAFDDEILNSVGATGGLLGRSIRRRGARLKLRADLVDPDWVRLYWYPFLLHAREKPFFFGWDMVNFPYEVGYFWSDGPIPPPVYSTTNLMAIELNAVGVASWGYIP